MIKGQFKNGDRIIKLKFYIKRDFKTGYYNPIIEYKIKGKFIYLFMSSYSYLPSRITMESCFNYYYEFYSKGTLATLIEQEILEVLEKERKRKEFRRIFCRW